MGKLVLIDEGKIVAEIINSSLNKDNHPNFTEVDENSAEYEDFKYRQDLLINPAE